MSDDEWVLLLWPLWVEDWLVAGGQQHRQQLLATKAAVEAATGWTWSVAELDDPPRRISFPDAGR